MTIGPTMIVSRPWARRRPRAAAGLGALILSATSGACSGPLNNEIAIGQAWVPASFDAREAATDPVFEGFPTPDPSVRTLERSDWPTTRFLVPNDQIAHQPRYTRPPLEATYDDKPRNRLGKYPTIEKALMMSAPGDAGVQAREALFAPVAAGLDVVLFPVRAVWSRPWQRTRTGLEPYERRPRAPQDVIPVVAEPQEPPPEPPMRPAEPLYGEDPPAPPQPGVPKP